MRDALRTLSVFVLRRRKMTLDITVTDMFCGAGGSTTGAVRAGAHVPLAINHWPVAIETHNRNYPQTTHVLTDISRADPWRYPSTTMLIASPECTNHSLSKGRRRRDLGQLPLPGFGEKGYDPAEERSRATMWDPLRWAECHRYALVILENVVDARLWVMWDAWLYAWQNLGYAFEIVYLNSMFAHPTPQSRDRLYFVAWKRGNRQPDVRIEPAAFCPKCARDVASVQSWKNPTRRSGKYRQQYIYCCPSCATEVLPYYYAAANAIDWSRPVQRIGDRKTPLKEKTLRRIAYGLEKFARSPFSVQVNTTTDRVRSTMRDPFPTQTADNGLALVSPFLLSLNHPNTRITPVGTQAFPTQTAYDDTALVAPPLLLSVSHAGQDEGRIFKASERTFPTQTGRADMAMVLPFIAELHGTSTARGVTDAEASVCAGGLHHGLAVPPPFLLDHVGEYRPRSLTRPLSTVVGEGNHQSLIVPPAWLMTYYNHGRLAPVEEAVPTVTTLERHALVTASTQDTDEEVCVEACGFRMLEWEEIRAAMAFPRDYVITGNRREKVKQLGNAVTPPAMEILIRRGLASLQEGRIPT
jgi:DNA (cytosine-5)-methyltransferase 1